MLTRAPRHDLGEKGPGCWVLSTSSASVTDKPGKEDPDDPKGGVRNYLHHGKAVAKVSINLDTGLVSKQ